MNNLTKLFVDVDDFLSNFLKKWHKSLISSGEKQSVCISTIKKR